MNQNPCTKIYSNKKVRNIHTNFEFKHDKPHDIMLDKLLVLFDCADILSVNIQFVAWYTKPVYTNFVWYPESEFLSSTQTVLL